MKKIRTFFALFIVLLLLTGTACSATDDMVAREGISNEGAYDSVEQAPSQGESRTGQMPDLQINTETPGKKIIYTASIALKADDATKAMDGIIQNTTELGGYLTDSSFVVTDDEQRGYVTVRIPPENIQELAHRIGNLGEVIDSSLSSEDVTEKYVDVEARLKNAEAQEAQLLDIMERAETIEETLLVRSELHYVQQEIEQYKGTLRYLDNHIDYSTVTVYITEKSIPTLPDVDPEEGVFARWTLSYIWANTVKGFRNSLAVVTYILGGIVILLSYILVPVLIIAALVVTILVLTKTIHKKQKRQKNDKQPPSDNRTQETPPHEDT